MNLLGWDFSNGVDFGIARSVMLGDNTFVLLVLQLIHVWAHWGIEMVNHIKDKVLANSHEQNMMHALLWTRGTESIFTQRTTRSVRIWFARSSNKISFHILPVTPQQACCCLGELFPFPSFWYMSMPIVCSCIHGNDVFSAIHAYEIFLIYTCGHYIVIFLFLHISSMHVMLVPVNLSTYPIDIEIKTHSICGIV